MALHHSTVRHRDHLQELHLFLHHSANRSAALKTAATTLGLCDLKTKNKNQVEVMSLLASECDGWRQIYPLLSRLAAVALVIPVSSVDCERDFSTMNRVKSDLRNSLQGEHLAVCLRVSINGSNPEEFNFGRALELFFTKPRTMRCSKAECRSFHNRML
ncbi:uncharacterized protein LOC131443548 isoform X3 [Solea solea]|uniref:uncharacterized protein LOC131443548 isoform X3 n=1 Tax=Solea solea TaxID=90069 RepID=UPI00272C2C37|nr:uncharacterized protein LOC131443548 isoform X3 [Solea solea]